MNPVYIQRLSACLPNAPVSNDDMEKVLGQIGERPSRVRRIILRSNGIQSRHYVLDPETGEPTMSNAQLTAEAVRGLFGDDFDSQDIDLLACGTSSPDQLAPSHGVMVHGELGGVPCEVLSFAGICCAGVGALKYAWLSVAGGQASRAVATGSEAVSTFMRARMFRQETASAESELEKRPELAFDRDFLRWMLSDGAGAMLLTPEPAPGRISLRIDWMEMISYANEQPACMYAGAEKQADGRLRGWREYANTLDAASRCVFTVKQDVRQLNEHIIGVAVEQALTEVLRRHPMAPEDIQWFVPHYSSDYFRSLMAQGLARVGFPIPEERWFSNLSRVGNVGSASIYLMLENLVRSGQLADGDRILCFVPESGRFSAAYFQLTAVAA
jgi:3-oxoacyl-[acyl-carrier-protein] synthase III